MRLCLVAPPTIELFEEGSIARTHTSKEVAEQIPLGILTLAAILERRAIELDILDLNQIYSHLSWPDPYHYREVDYFSLAVSELSRLDFDIIGFSTMCSTYPLSLRIAREMRRLCPGVKIILGGPQASVVDEETLKAFPFIDFVVRGEAEETFPELLAALDEDRDPVGVPGITYRNGTHLIRNPNASVILDLDALPLPAYHRFTRISECGYIPLELGRGCPFACTFCSTNDFFRRRFRLKSPSKVIEQMCLLEQAYGATSFELVHDMFTVDRRRVVAFCEALLTANKEFTWNCSARTDSVDDDLLCLMAEAGCRGIFFGIETGSARMQKVIHKNLDLKEARRLVPAAAKAGIKVTPSFIDGYPEEQKEDLVDTVDFMMHVARFDRVYPQINIIAPLAGTQLLTQYREQLSLDDVFSDMSHMGWRQDPADLELIAAHPNIFPNFYGIPSAVGRAYANEFNRFLMYSLVRFRWLLVALHQRYGSLLYIFDRWLRWRVPVVNPDRYYCTVAFSREFKSFLREMCLTPGNKSAVGIESLLKYYDALDEAFSPQGDPAEDHSQIQPASAMLQSSIPRLTVGTRLLSLDVDVKKVIDHLRLAEPIAEDVTSATVLAARNGRKGEIELFEMPSISALILRLCDGARDVEGVVREFSLKAGIAPSDKAEAICQEGLALLNGYALIEFESAEYQGSR